ncbi:MAG TPA: carboxylate--amine ligase [Allosphingosinicella sp.]|jgi:predicted ATP-grasp superfamily ATP-dependent carboligase
MTARPPVIVLGIDSPIGLTVVRELGAAGVGVHGVARDRRALGLYSRHLARGYLRDGELCAQLLDIARTSGASLVMTVSMGDALAVRAAADDGRLPGLTPLLPPAAKLALVNDKAAICGVAERLGIPVPLTWQPTAADFDTAVPRDVGYPCILKWRDPEEAAAPLARLGLPLLKSEFAHDEAELRAALARYRPAGLWPLVQSYCPGTGLGQMFLMKDGRALMRFQHRRLHEWPPEGGVSTLCESIAPGEHRALMQKSEALLREIGWEGPAMVEYRHDAATGETALMEINGRFWGSLPLASHAGARFALGSYLALGLGYDLPEASYRPGLRCRYMVPETRRLVRVTLGRKAIPDRRLAFSPAREVLRWLGGFLGGRYYVFSLRDPLPFLADLGFIAGAAVRGVFSRLRPHRTAAEPRLEPLKR